jgi:hypothetical protein
MIEDNKFVVVFAIDEDDVGGRVMYIVNSAEKASLLVNFLNGGSGNPPGVGDLNKNVYSDHLVEDC